MRSASGSRRSRGQRGFTIIELMVALTVLLIGVAGLVALQRSSLRATSYARHATEATMLAERTMEELRTRSGSNVILLSPYTDEINAKGVINGTGFKYTRAWTATQNVNSIELELTVSWTERGEESHSIQFRTERAP